MEYSKLTEIAPGAIIAALVTTPYWLVPLVLKGKMKHSAENRYQRIWLNSIPVEAQNAFDVATRGLASCGFRALAHLTAAKQSNLVEDSYISIWANPATGDSAQVIAVRSRRPDGTYRCEPLVTFRREFGDGSKIITTNSRSPSVFPVDPAAHTIVCRDCWDFALLYAFHHARAERRHPGQRGRLLPECPNGVGADGRDATIDAFHAETMADMQRVTDAGYFFFDESANAYRPTVKGAYVMTWRLLWPLKQRRMRQRAAAADRELRDMGFGGLQEFRARQRPLMPHPIPGAFGFPVAPTPAAPPMAADSPQVAGDTPWRQT